MSELQILFKRARDASNMDRLWFDRLLARSETMRELILLTQEARTVDLLYFFEHPTKLDEAVVEDACGCSVMSLYRASDQTAVAARIKNAEDHIRAARYVVRSELDQRFARLSR